jgi:hypothetical protein
MMLQEGELMDSPAKEFRGIVVPGRGFGAQRMTNPTVVHAMHQCTTLTLVPGTLNVRLPQPFDGLLPWYVTEADLGGHVWWDHAPNRAGICCGEVMIAGRYRGIIFQGDEIVRRT